MTDAEQAKFFCRMSFVYPSKFPCVETHSAAKIFNFLAFQTFTPEDFNVFLAEIFGTEVDAGNCIFRLGRSDFYQNLYQAFKFKDAEIFNQSFKQFENACKGGVNLAIYPGRQENSEMLVSKINSNIQIPSANKNDAENS